MPVPIRPQLAQIHASKNTCWIEHKNFSYYQNNPIHSKALVCDCDDLKGKRILNENILITNFPDIHPYEFPPIFVNAKNVFMHHNYKYFTYYWLNKIIFPNNPTIYLDGDPCDTP